MTCEACQSQLLEYVYEELGPAQKRETEAHLATCEACGRELAEIREALSLAREALPVEVPSEEGVASLLAYAEQQAARMKEARAPAPRGLLPAWLSRIVLRPGFALGLFVVAIAGLSIKLASDVVQSSSHALAGADVPASPSARQVSTQKNIRGFANRNDADTDDEFAAREAPRGWLDPSEPEPAPKASPATAEQKPMPVVAAKPAEPPAPVATAAPAAELAYKEERAGDQGKRGVADAPTMLEEQLGAKVAEAPRRKNEAPADGLLADDRGGAEGLDGSYDAPGSAGRGVGLGGLGSSGSIGTKGMGVGGGGTSAGDSRGPVGAPASPADKTAALGYGGGRSAGAATGAAVDSLDRRPAKDSDAKLEKRKDAGPANREEEPPAKADSVLEESRRFSKSRADTTIAAPERELSAAAPAAAAPAPPPPAPTAPAYAPRSFAPSGGAVAGAELDDGDVVGLGGAATRDAKKRPVSAGKAAAGESGADEARARREAHAGVVSNAITEIEQAETLYREAQRLAAAERRAEAVAVYLRVADGYPGSDRARQSLYAAWLIEHERGATASSGALLARLERAFPGSSELALARARLAREKGGRVEAEKKENKRPAARSRVDFADEAVEKSQAPVEMAPAEAAPPAEPVRAY